jgi:hypothetical protein
MTLGCTSSIKFSKLTELSCLEKPVICGRKCLLIGSDSVNYLCLSVTLNKVFFAEPTVASCVTP